MKYDKTIFLEDIVTDYSEVKPLLKWYKWSGGDIFDIHRLNIDMHLHVYNSFLYALSRFDIIDDVLYIDSFEVNNKVRGKGFGTLAFLEIITNGVNSGVNEIELCSFNKQSDKFYRKLKLEEYDESVFVGDEKWVKGFIKSMTRQKIDLILDQLE